MKAQHRFRAVGVAAAAVCTAAAVAVSPVITPSLSSGVPTVLADVALLDNVA